ncbi:MAG TPA: 16S rRNA (cytidine(1402)-2'-O)-methyltransferase [Candidatus Syntrophosphaera sp.]|nr:16S rRNA (cytidine(1402)-2'-O)-methyltransferase [Candidatus Syntrophosphaera sp.]
MPAGSLYLVPVPVGNLGDITLRALDTLKSVDLIAAEDTRKTRFLLSHYEIKAPRLLSLHKYNEKQRLEEILALLHEGKSIAVVSDAGSPGISDPAFWLVRAAIEAGVDIIPLPGATALIPAITASGLDTGSFLFLGFLPLKQKDRAAKLDLVASSPHTIVIYEAPHRLKQTLEDILARCGDRQVCLAREISKLHEEFIRGNLESILADYQMTEKGEFVVLIEAAAPEQPASEEEIKSCIAELAPGPESSKELAENIAKRFKVSRNRAYQMILDIRKKCG